MIVAIALLWLLAGCTEQYDVFPGKEQPEAGSIVLYLPELTRASADLTEAEKEQYAELAEKEQKVDDLDVFVFPADDGISALCVFHQRYNWNTDVIDNTTTNPYINLGAKGKFEAGKKYKVYVLANCSEGTQTELDKFLTADGNALPLRDLQGLVQTDANIYLAATDEVTYFLMDGTASLNDKGDDATPPEYVESVVLNDGKLTELTNLYVTLRRSAAKMTVSLGHENKVKFPDSSWSPEETAETSKSVFFYSLTNLRTDTYVVDPLNDVLPAVPSLVQSGQITLQETSLEKETLNFVTYSYSHDWSGSASTFENGSYLVVNIPIFYSEDGFDVSFNPSNLDWTKEGDVWEASYNNNIVRYYPANYYKIPMGKDSKLKRNTHYVIRGTITQAGSTSPEEPETLETIPFETVDWIDVDIEVGGESGIQYLYVNKNAYELRNQDVDNTLMFASSHPVTVKLKEAYYVDKNSVKKILYNDDEQKQDTVSITAVPSSTYQGSITLSSPVPKNNLIRTIVLEVSNTVKQTETVTITQYPLDFIQYRYGLFSYVKNYGGYLFSNYDYRTIKEPYYMCMEGWNSTNNTYNPLENWKNEGPIFCSKYYNRDEGGIYFYDYRNSGNFTPGISTTAGDYRMYHIQITSTSDEYTLARPKLDENGNTSKSDDNKNIVSPSFMINSQLGTSVNVVSDLTKAHVYASCYAEVYEDGGKHYVYNDWRLPTEAEIKIILKYQELGNQKSEAMFKVLGGGRIWSASGEVENNNADNDNLGIRLVRDIFDEDDLKGIPIEDIFEDDENKSKYVKVSH